MIRYRDSDQSGFPSIRSGCRYRLALPGSTSHRSHLLHRQILCQNYFPCRTTDSPEIVQRSNQDFSNPVVPTAKHCLRCWNNFRQDWCRSASFRSAGPVPRFPQVLPIASLHPSPILSDKLQNPSHTDPGRHRISLLPDILP